MAEGRSPQIVFRVLMRDESDVAQARLRVRDLAVGRGLRASAVEALVTATSELARNVIVHGRGGELLIGTVDYRERTGLTVLARDSGPGISNIDDAMRDGFSTGTGLGLGLPSARRLVDEFEIQSRTGEGTTVTLTMWFDVRHRA
jgi:serine/threonine-protein kinase RsbT